MIEQAVAMFSLKGGVGKSSTTANVGGFAALSGWKTLIVDLDRQGDAGKDLSVPQRGLSDGGEALLSAFLGQTRLEPVRGVRDNIDYVPSGPATKRIHRMLAAAADDDPILYRLEEVIAEIADDYDLVLIDCPPGDERTQLAILSTVHFVVATSKSDPGSIEGIADAIQQMVFVKGPANPDLALLGVVLFAVGRSMRRVRRNARDTFARTGGGNIPIFDTTIRSAPALADEARRYGLLAYELEEAAGRQSDKLSRQREWGRLLGDDDRRRIRRECNPCGLGEDYRQLAADILALVNDNIYQEVPA